MSDLALPSTHGRRSALFAGLALSPAALFAGTRPAQAAYNAAIQDITRAGADPTGMADSSAAIQLAFNRLPSTGGCLYVPSGTYLLGSPLVLDGKPVALRGDGSNASLFVMDHAGTAFSFTTGSVYNAVHVTGIGIAGPPDAVAAGAIAVVVPAAAQETGYQSCLIDDVAIGTPSANGANGCQILLGLSLVNVWKSLVSNVRMFGPFGGAQGCFVRLASSGGGKCIDNKFVDCVADGPAVGYAVAGYAEGLHILGGLVICGTGFSSAYGNYANGINLLGLYIRGCEFNCSGKAAELYQVWSGWIGDSHFGTSSTGVDAVVGVTGCVNLFLGNLWITGRGGSPYGIIVQGSGAAGSAANKVNGVTFENLGNGVLFGQGAISNLVLGIQMVNQAAFPSMLSTGVAVDQSGNVGGGTNNAQWLTNEGPLRTLY